jgi:hypothetical protein
MKKIISQLFLILCVVALCASCDKDGDTIYVDGFGSSDLIATASEVKLDVSQRSTVVLQLAWKNPTLLSSDESNPVPDNLLTNYVEVSASSDFTNASETAVSGLTKAYTGTELNTLAKTLGIEVNHAGDLYFRIKSVEGDNIDPAYSNTCKVTVTPYFVDMTRMAVLASNKTDTIAYLHSPAADGIYTGYMNATAWLNCWFYEYSGTTWGNYAVDGHAFEISDASDAWNCWFADGAGQWYVTVDTQAMEWSAMLLSQLRVNGSDMTYYSKKKQWGYYITTTKANETFTIEADGKEYNKDTRTDTYVTKDVKFALNDGVLTQSSSATAATIAKPGTYTIIVEANDNGEYVYSVVEGQVDFNAGDQPEVNYPSQLYMTSTDGNTDLVVLQKTSDTTYSGQYTLTADWENFKVYDRENDVLYGSDPSDVYTLLAGDGAWNIWFDDGAKAGETVTVTVNLKTLTWSYSK